MENKISIMMIMMIMMIITIAKVYRTAKRDFSKKP